VATIVDAHNDLLLELVLRERETNPFRGRWLEQLERGGVRVQVCPMYAAGEKRPREVALAQAAAFDRAVAENGDRVVHARTRAELDDRRLALILSLEGVEPLEGDAAAFDEWWERGVRLASLTWNYSNAFGGGIDDPEQGVTDAGRALVRRMGELGAIIDLAHASPRTFADVLELVPDGGVCVTHAGCRALNDVPRNLSDEQLRALAERGGVHGVMALVLTVGPDQPTLARFVDHVEHAVAVMGVEHVGLGADFIDQVLESEIAAASELEQATEEAMRLGGGTLAIRELQGPADYPRLLDALRRRGFDGERVDAIAGRNWLRLLRGALPG